MQDIKGSQNYKKIDGNYKINNNTNIKNCSNSNINMISCSKIPKEWK